MRRESPTERDVRRMVERIEALTRIDVSTRLYRLLIEHRITDRDAFINLDEESMKTMQGLGEVTRKEVINLQRRLEERGFRREYRDERRDRSNTDRNEHAAIVVAISRYLREPLREDVIKFLTESKIRSVHQFVCLTKRKASALAGLSLPAWNEMCRVQDIVRGALFDADNGVLFADNMQPLLTSSATHGRPFITTTSESSFDHVYLVEHNGRDYRRLPVEEVLDTHAALGERESRCSPYLLSSLASKYGVTVNPVAMAVSSWYRAEEMRSRAAS